LDRRASWEERLVPQPLKVIAEEQAVHARALWRVGDHSTIHRFTRELRHMWFRSAGKPCNTGLKPFRRILLRRIRGLSQNRCAPRLAAMNQSKPANRLTDLDEALRLNTDDAGTRASLQLALQALTKLQEHGASGQR
jgi:hypothetical protein